MIKVYIIHGWGGYSEEGWFPWLKKELEKRRFKVYVPKMPDADAPEISKWINFLNKNVKDLDKETFFIGHSIGCQAILRFLELKKEKIGGAVFIAGWFNLTEEATPTQEEMLIAQPWIEEPINFKKIRKNLKKVIAIFSDNDPYVKLDNKGIFEKELNAKIIIEHNKHHLGGEANIKQLSSVLEAILEIANG